MGLFHNGAHYYLCLFIICILKQHTLSISCSDNAYQFIKLCLREQMSFPCCNFKNYTMYCCPFDEYRHNFNSKIEELLNSKEQVELTKLDSNVYNFDVDVEKPIESRNESSLHRSVIKYFSTVIGLAVIAAAIIRRISKAVETKRNNASNCQDEQRLQNSDTDDSPDTDFNIIIVSQRCSVPAPIHSEIISVRNEDMAPIRSSSPPPQYSSSLGNVDDPPPSYEEVTKRVEETK